MTTVDREREALAERIRALVLGLAGGGRDDAARDALLADLARYQAARVPAYGRLCEARGLSPRAPALPTDVFRFTRVASHPPEEDVRVFRTSGTTHGERGAHPHRDLSLYDAAARAAGRHMLFPDRPTMPLVMLVPREDEAPDSSLGYMCARFAEWFGEGGTLWVLRRDRLDVDALAARLEAAMTTDTPVALLGTSFAFVHADEALGDRRFALPPGSRLMPTGGFKGRSRELDPDAMRALLSDRYGVPESHVVAEYGMTELGSQMYETTLREALSGEAPGPRRLWVPGWVRAEPVDPETLEPVSGDAVGLLRIDDPTNLDSVSAIQTSDLARREGDGIVLLGRAPGAVPRGCSLAAEEALG